MVNSNLYAKQIVLFIFFDQCASRISKVRCDDCCLTFIGVNYADVDAGTGWSITSWNLFLIHSASSCVQFFHQFVTQFTKQRFVVGAKLILQLLKYSVKITFQVIDYEFSYVFSPVAIGHTKDPQVWNFLIVVCFFKYAISVFLVRSAILLLADMIREFFKPWVVRLDREGLIQTKLVLFHVG